MTIQQTCLTLWHLEDGFACPPNTPLNRLVEWIQVPAASVDCYFFWLNRNSGKPFSDCWAILTKAGGEGVDLMSGCSAQFFPCMGFGIHQPVWDPSTGLGSINRTILQNERSYCKQGANCKICQPSQVVVLSLHEQEQWLHVGQKAAAGKEMTNISHLLSNMIKSNWTNGHPWCQCCDKFGRHAAPLFQHLLVSLAAQHPMHVCKQCKWSDTFSPTWQWPDQRPKRLTKKGLIY